MTPIAHEGYLYGIAGRHQARSRSILYKNRYRREVWRNRISWTAQIMNRELNLELFRGSYLKVNNHYLGLSELGSLVLLKMNEQGVKVLDTKQLFFARNMDTSSTKPWLTLHCAK